MQCFIVTTFSMRNGSASSHS